MGAALVLVASAALIAGCQRSPAGGEGAPAGATPAAGSMAPATPTTAATPGGSPAVALVSRSGEARAREIRAASAQWPKVEGRWTRGDTDSRYVAYFDGGRLRYLEEETNAGKTGARRANRYWFDDGSLFYYDGEKPSSVPGGDGPGMLPPNVAVVAEFRGADVVRAVAREHYGEKKLDDTTIAGIRRHAAALAGAAQDEWSARQR
jgi:hypothetical protein